MGTGARWPDTSCRAISCGAQGAQVSASIRTTAEAEQQISLATEWWQANRRESAELLESELAEAFTLFSSSAIYRQAIS
jgi:hypothetical protein